MNKTLILQFPMSAAYTSCLGVLQTLYRTKAIKAGPDGNRCVECSSTGGFRLDCGTSRTGSYIIIIYACGDDITNIHIRVYINSGTVLETEFRTD